MSAARVLIVKTSSMGDIVHALPLVTDLAQARPDLALDWVVEEGFAAIPRMHPAVARVIPVALRRWRTRPADPSVWREIGAARAALRAQPYQAILDCQGLIKSALIARVARGPRHGFDNASAREPWAAALYLHRHSIARQQHAIARNRQLGAAALGYAVQGLPRFGLKPARAAADNPAGEYAVLLTNASRATKLWPDSHWAAVHDWLADRGMRTVLFWGSAHEERETQRRAAAMAGATIAPRSTLEQIAVTLAGARLVIGLDTGLSHLAAALGVPTVGIYCDYDPALVGVTGDAPCASVGGVDAAPDADRVIAAARRVLTA